MSLEWVAECLWNQWPNGSGILTPSGRDKLKAALALQTAQQIGKVQDHLQDDVVQDIEDAGISISLGQSSSESTTTSTQSQGSKLSGQKVTLLARDYPINCVIPIPLIFRYHV